MSSREPVHRHSFNPVNWLETWGGRALGLCDRFGNYLVMLADTLIGLLQLEHHCFRYLARVTAQQIYFTAVESFKLCIFVGWVMGMLLVLPLTSLGIDDFSLVTVIYSTVGFHNLIPLVVAIIVIGRSGTAITTELGGFKIAPSTRRQIKGAVESDQLILLPRIIGACIAMICMNLWATVAAIGGTSLLYFLEFRLPIIDIVRICLDDINTKDIAITVFMLLCYGVTIASVHAYYGFKSNDTIELAQNVPRAFVKSFSSCLAITLAFALARGG